MNLTVFGATGRLGRHVLEQGLRRGHKLTAFTRRPEALADPAALAAVVAGDGRDRQAVRRAIDGADGVIAIVAAATRKGPHHTTEVARVITQAMADLGVRRLVVTDPYPIVGDRPRLPIWLMRRFLAAAYADARTMEQVVSSTDLDWTIVRLNRLLDKPAGGTAHVSRDLLAKPSSMRQPAGRRLSESGPPQVSGVPPGPSSMRRDRCCPVSGDLVVLSHAIWSTSHLNWTNPRACLSQSGPHRAAAQ